MDVLGEMISAVERVKPLRREAIAVRSLAELGGFPVRDPDRWSALVGLPVYESERVPTGEYWLGDEREIRRRIGADLDTERQ